jgi:hypothetical protein
MQVEQKQRQDIEALKTKEFEMAQHHIHQFVEGSDDQDDDLDQPMEVGLGQVSTINEIVDESSDDDIDVEAIRARIKKQRAPAELPPPRSQETTSVHISFTSRGVIPTNTARETEDSKWLTRIKLAKAIQKKSDASQSEVFKQKAIEFFKLGDFESALNGFTVAFEKDPTDIRYLVHNRVLYPIGRRLC